MFNNRVLCFQNIIYYEASQSQKMMNFSSLSPTVTPIITTTTPSVPNTTTIPYGPILPSNDKCNYYIVNQTSIAWLDFGNPYGGIPQNLLINSVSLQV